MQNRKEVQNLIDQGLLILGGNVTIQDNVMLGLPDAEHEERKPIVIGDNSIIRAGSIIYEGVSIGKNVSIGHQCIIRGSVQIGDNSLIAHQVSIEFSTKIGQWVRVSVKTHLTREMLLEDFSFIGAGVYCIDDDRMIWRQDQKAVFKSPVIRKAARVGTGTTLGYGVEIAENAVVGSGSNVVTSIPSNSIAYGDKAIVKKNKKAEDLHLGLNGGIPK